MVEVIFEANLYSIVLYILVLIDKYTHTIAETVAITIFNDYILQRKKYQTYLNFLCWTGTNCVYDLLCNQHIYCYLIINSFLCHYQLITEQGGSLRMDRWRSEVDMLLINVARSACDMGGSYGQKPSTFGEPNISEFQLASLKGLLASFLSSHARPPYLANGIELFRKGNIFRHVFIGFWMGYLNFSL